MFAPAADADKRQSAVGVFAPGDHWRRNRLETAVSHHESGVPPWSDRHMGKGTVPGLVAAYASRTARSRRSAGERVAISA
jgi:hypothetical protein